MVTNKRTDQDAGDAAAPTDDLDTQLNTIREALSLLSNREREIVRLYYFELVPIKEVGETMGLSERRVSQLRHRAVRKLGSIINEAKHQAAAHTGALSHLRGLGSDYWRSVDVEEYVSAERASWTS